MGESVKNRLRKLDIRPTQSLGQNFLDDPNIAEKIVDHAGLTSSDTVIEIGPGLGVLTDIIVERAGKTILVEKDKALAGYLDGRYSQYKTEVIEGDVLDIDLPEFDKVVSNLPFSISSPITFKLLDYDFDLAVLTYQKEFADRMIAAPGEENYSRLSVMISVSAEVKKLFDIPKECFYPPPKVDATVIELTLSEPDFDLTDKEFFSKVVKELFNYRRKQIKNALELGLDVEIKEVPYAKKRVGNISPEQINEIAEYLVDEGIYQKG